MKEIKEMGAKKSYRVSLGFYVFLLFTTILTLLGALFIILVALSLGYLALFFAALMIVMALWSVMIVISALWWRLTFTIEGLEYRVLGYSLFAEWSDIKIVESRRYGDFVVVERGAVSGNPIFGFLSLPLTSQMEIPLSSGPMRIWGRDVIPDIVAFAQISKSK